MLDVDGRQVRTTDVTYDDLVVLYKQFIKKNGRVPVTAEGLSKNNLPQGRIINKILKKAGVMYKDFILQFGKVAKVRTENPQDYDKYVQKFINICKQRGKSLTIKELMCNQYGLPGSNWFIKYCPDRKVKSYKQFLSYCGLEQNKHIWTKDEVATLLKNYQKNIGRPITKNDLRVDKAGVSGVVVQRLYGGLTQAKQEIGLLETEIRKPLPFEYYRDILTKIVLEYKKSTNKDYITWNEIESGKYCSQRVEHKTFMRSFNNANVNIHEYIKSLGCMLNPSNFSYTYIFDDGEKVASNMEYCTTSYIRSLGLKYNNDYYREQKYSSFTPEKSRINCDYTILCPKGNLYIEVAGMIDNLNGNWREKEYPSKIENDYREKMKKKETILNENNIEYLFLFSNDFQNDNYKRKIKEMIDKLNN